MTFISKSPVGASRAHGSLEPPPHSPRDTWLSLRAAPHGRDWDVYDGVAAEDGGRLAAGGVERVVVLGDRGRWEVEGGNGDSGVREEE